MIPIPAILPVWQWFAKMGAPILAAFLIGQYVAGRNCEEDQLREDIAALEASASVQAALLKSAEDRRLESEKALTAALASRKEAVNDEIRINPSYAACRALPYPRRLRLPPLSRADPPAG